MLINYTKLGVDDFQRVVNRHAWRTLWNLWSLIKDTTFKAFNIQTNVARTNGVKTNVIRTNGATKKAVALVNVPVTTNAVATTNILF